MRLALVWSISRVSPRPSLRSPAWPRISLYSTHSFCSVFRFFLCSPVHVLLYNCWTSHIRTGWRRRLSSTPMSRFQFVRPPLRFPPSALLTVIMHIWFELLYMSRQCATCRQPIALDLDIVLGISIHSTRSMRMGCMEKEEDPRSGQQAGPGGAARSSSGDGNYLIDSVMTHTHTHRDAGWKANNDRVVVFYIFSFSAFSFFHYFITDAEKKRSDLCVIFVLLDVYLDWVANVLLPFPHVLCESIKSFQIKI